MRQETMGFWYGSGIRLTIRKQAAPHSRQITTQHLMTQFLQAWCPTNGVKALTVIHRLTQKAQWMSLRMTQVMPSRTLASSPWSECAECYQKEPVGSWKIPKCSQQPCCPGPKSISAKYTISSHCSSMQMAQIDLWGKISYWCSIVTLGLG